MTWLEYWAPRWFGCAVAAALASFGVFWGVTSTAHLVSFVRYVNRLSREVSR